MQSICSGARLIFKDIRDQLDRFKPRNACVAQLNAQGLDFEFIDAVDGRTLASAFKATHYNAAENVRRFKRPLTDGEIGCYFSHKAALGIAASESHLIIVFEDDFCASEHFRMFLPTIQSVTLDYCLLKLDGQLADALPANERESAGSAVEIRNYKIIPPYTTGYIIRPRDAGRMLSARTMFFRPVDIDIKHPWGASSGSFRRLTNFLNTEIING